MRVGRPEGLHYISPLLAGLKACTTINAYVALDRQIDELYQLPLGEFTAARNALAKTVGGADASRLKRLEKPTVVPWAINQLYWHDRAAWDRLMKSGAALRTAQIAALEGKKADVRKASEAHRKALAESVDRATQLAAEHGAKPAPEPLARMLEALSISAAPLPHPGRLTDIVQPAGFEALTGVTPHAVPFAAAKRSETTVKAGAAQKKQAEVIQIDREAVRRAESARREQEAMIAAATRTLERARAAESQARRALARAEEEVRAAEAALDRAKG